MTRIDEAAERGLVELKAIIDADIKEIGGSVLSFQEVVDMVDLGCCANSIVSPKNRMLVMMRMMNKLYETYGVKWIDGGIDFSLLKY